MIWVIRARVVPSGRAMAAWLVISPARRHGTDDLAGRHTTRQAADVAVLECPSRPKANLDRLCAQFGATLCLVNR